MYSSFQTPKKYTKTLYNLNWAFMTKLGSHDYTDEIVSKAFQRINVLFRSFISGNISILTKAFITYVRPLVEYCSYIWSPHQLYLIQKIERVQKYFTRRALHGAGLHYKERFQVLNLESLEIRRIKSDVKLCFKIVNGLCDLDPSKFFELLPQSFGTRGHSMKLIKPICYTNCQLNFFSSRVVNYWNSLPPDIVNAVSFGSFVNRLNSHAWLIFFL